MNTSLVGRGENGWDYSGLKALEEQIFGSTEHRSSVSIRLDQIRQTGSTRIPLMPHHHPGYCSTSKSNCDKYDDRNKYCNKGIPREAGFYDFNLILACGDPKTSEILKRVAIASFLLGGLGKRSRRGFGSIQVLSIDGEPFSHGFDVDSLKATIGFVPASVQPDYPFVRDVQLGRKFPNYADLLIKIGESSSTNCNESLGFAKGQSRLSSPIWVSVLKENDMGFYPILTWLNYSPSRNMVNASLTSHQSNFINALK